MRRTQNKIQHSSCYNELMIQVNLNDSVSHCNDINNTRKPTELQNNSTINPTKNCKVCLLIKETMPSLLPSLYNPQYDRSHHPLKQQLPRIPHKNEKRIVPAQERSELNPNCQAPSGSVRSSRSGAETQMIAGGNHKASVFLRCRIESEIEIRGLIACWWLAYTYPRQSTRLGGSG